MKEKIKIVFVLVTIMFISCGNFPSMYENRGRAIEFISSSKCVWYEGNTFLNGTYKKIKNGYEIKIEGQGFYQNTIFIATKYEKDLIITGGVLNKRRFTKTNGKIKDLNKMQKDYEKEIEREFQKEMNKLYEEMGVSDKQLKQKLERMDKETNRDIRELQKQFNPRENKIECIGDGCNKPRQGQIIIKESTKK
jgi:hypothetical protein